LASRTHQRVLTCGNYLTFGQHGLAMAPDADAAHVWHGVAEVLYRVRQADKLRESTHFVMVKDIGPAHAPGARQLENLSYRYVETEPNMVLALEPAWRTHEDYLASLASKYRSAVKNAVMKPIDEAGVQLIELAEHHADIGTRLAQYRDRMFELYCAVQANAAFRPFMLRPHYFEALARAAGAGFRCAALMKGDTMLGFLVSVKDGDTSVAHHIGFDRDAAETLPLYLRLLHAGIAHGIALGAKRISFGRTALAPKVALGAKPETFAVLVRHRQPVVNKLIKAALLGVEHEEAPERDPFKKGKG
jgi:predicted N-acyltransferase